MVIFLAILLWAIVGTPSVHAVTLDAVNIDEKGDTGTTLTIPHTTTTGGGNRGAYALCGLRSRTITASATYAGVSMTDVRSGADAHASTNIRAYLFRLIDPTTGTNDFVITQSSGTAMVCLTFSVTNLHQSVPETDTDGDCTGGTNGSLTLTTGTNELLLDAFAMAITGSGTEGANQTEHGDLAASTNTLTVAGSTQDGADGGAMTYTASAGAVTCYIAASLKHDEYGSVAQRGGTIFLP